MAGISKQAREELAEIKARFTTSTATLSQEQQDALADLEKAFSNVATKLAKTLPDSRNRATALTQLEVSAAFAAKAVSQGLRGTEEPAPAKAEEPAGEQQLTIDDAQAETAPRRRRPRAQGE